MPAPINPQFPVARVRSEAELMDIAVAMEREAADRYVQLAELMGRRGETELTATFRSLAELERRHETGLVDWAKRDNLPAPRPARFSWRLPETFAMEDADRAQLSPYQALAIAVRNEEQAFAFYTYVVAQADVQPEVRRRAEAMAREELDHVAQLRQMRRSAYHGNRRERRSAADRVSTLPGLHQLAWGLERGSADLAMACARALERQGNAAGAVLLRHAGSEATRWAEAFAEVIGGPTPVGSSVVEGAHGLLATASAQELLRLCERDAMEILEAYMGIAERAGTEVLLHAAQELAQGAVARLALIRSQLPDLWNPAEP